MMAQAVQYVVRQGRYRMLVIAVLALPAEFPQRVLVQPERDVRKPSYPLVT
jgi:hypothetical protein